MAHATREPSRDKKREEKEQKDVAERFLIAATVWLLPGAEAGQFHVIALMTYLVAISGAAHIVAGSMESFMLVVNGETGVWRSFAGFAVPALLGNVVGGPPECWSAPPQERKRSSAASTTLSRLRPAS